MRLETKSFITLPRLLSNVVVEPLDSQVPTNSVPKRTPRSISAQYEKHISLPPPDPFEFSATIPPCRATPMNATALKQFCDEIEEPVSFDDFFLSHPSEL
ncbi:hypothetical protein BLNAU_9145 [Blattamonas nauphoetae]|uniref:Uncharacterized protein n=1 Tax=Blattamonas nauphoetae TaxID=2049346 RepID=A0ABQ9XWE4_9EUKA|nr:hypothetical protein BLNAU_9145 [Blattamonas nauphoetae]